MLLPFIVANTSWLFMIKNLVCKVTRPRWKVANVNPYKKKGKIQKEKKNALYRNLIFQNWKISIYLFLNKPFTVE